MATVIFLVSASLSFIGLSHQFGWALAPISMLVAYVIGFLTVIIIYVFHFPVVLSLPSDHPYKSYLMRSIARFINRFVIRLKVSVTGQEHIPSQGKLIIYANHKSYSDGFALLEAIDRPLTFTPKKSVLSIPILRGWLRAYDVFPINRNNARETSKDLEQAVKTVSKGLALSIFPEGHIKYRHEENVTEMKHGAFKIALKSQADLLIIRFDGNHLTKHRTPFRSTRRHLTILPVIPYDTYKNWSTSEIAAYVMTKINEAKHVDIIRYTNA